MQTTYPLPQAQGGSRIRRPRRWQRWLIGAALIVGLAGGGLWWRSSQATTATTTTTASVSLGDLSEVVSGSGTVAAARTVDVAFAQDGTVTAVNVQVGDQVSAGQALAAIDAADLTLALELAEANLASAQAQLAQVQSGDATAEDLASAQAQLTSAQAQLAQTQSGSATAAEVASARAQLASAQAQLAALTSPSEADIAAAQRSVQQAELALQSTRDSASQSKTNADLALQNATNSLTQAQVSLATAEANWSFVQQTSQDPTNPETTDSSGKTVKNKLNETQRQQYYDAYASAQAQLKSAENAVTQAQVAYEAARQSEVTQIAQAEATVADAQAQLDALKHPTASAVAAARASVAQAQASLDSLTAPATDAELASANASVAQAQASLDSLTAPATDAELASAKAAVLQAQVARDAAQADLDAAALTAPFDGVVGAVGVTAGGSASGGTITLADLSTMTVGISLSESDLAEVKVGQPVELTFDALPDVTLTGTVATIAPVASSEQNVVTYAVQVAFDPADSGVRAGMSASADITVAQATGALLVPSRAVQTSGDASTVTVVAGDSTVQVPVETGLTSDGSTQILSSGGARALAAGDTVVIAGTTASSSTTQSTQQSSGLGALTDGPGAGGPPPGP